MAESRVEVETYERLLDHVLEESAEAFGDMRWHSIIDNLSSVRPEDWDVLPPGGGRTIRELVLHIGSTFPFYASRAFGDGTRPWDDKVIHGVEPGPTPEAMITWLRTAHAEFRVGLESLTDDRLTELRWPMEGEAPWDLRRIVEIQIQHTLYHAGEINHLRALLQGNDIWD